MPLNSQSRARDTATLPHMDSLVTVPTVRYIQPAQRSPSCDQQLTNSDEELLHACELFDALQNTTSSTKRYCNPESIYLDLPMENVSMHNLAPEPTMQNFEEALILTVEEWARRTIQANANSELPRLLDADEQDLAKIVLYVNDISPHFRIVPECPPSLWIWCATEWLPGLSLLQQLQQRITDYHPYVWDEEQCKLFATTEAAACDMHLTMHDHQSFLSKYDQFFTHTNEVPRPQPAAMDLNPTSSNSSASTLPAT